MATNDTMAVSDVKVKAKKRSNALRQNTAPLHIMLIPGIFFVLVYAYAPMVGIVIAFQHFDPINNTSGSLLSLFFSSPWAKPYGMGIFINIFQRQDAMDALVNTVIIAVWKIVTMFFSPIILALLLNEVRRSFVKRSVQTIVYLPHFLSWVILGGIVIQILSKYGVVNNVLKSLDSSYQTTSFLMVASYFKPIVIITNIWKEIGWSTIIYLAAISGVDPTLYEAAVMDGAGKWKQCLHVTIPGMKPIIILSMVLSLQGVLNAGFDQIFNLYSATIYKTADIIDTYIYRISIRQQQYSIGAAIGLFKSFISLILIAASYGMAYKFAGYEIF